MKYWRPTVGKTLIQITGNIQQAENYVSPDGEHFPQLYVPCVIDNTHVLWGFSGGFFKKWGTYGLLRELGVPEVNKPRKMDSALPISIWVEKRGSGINTRYSIQKAEEKSTR